MGSSAPLTFSEIKQTQPARVGQGTFGTGSFAFGGGTQTAAPAQVATTLKPSDLDTQGSLLRIHHVDGKGIETVAAQKGYLAQSKLLLSDAHTQSRSRLSAVAVFKAPEPAQAKPQVGGLGGFGKPAAPVQQVQQPAQQLTTQKLIEPQQVTLNEVKKMPELPRENLCLSYVAPLPTSDAKQEPAKQTQSKSETAEKKGETTVEKDEPRAVRPVVEQKKPQLTLFECLRMEATRSLEISRSIAGRN